jgi:alkylation response protein AidB-like acyl-CoA dehydrogenase
VIEAEGVHMDFFPSEQEKAFDRHVRVTLDETIGPEYPAWAEQDTTPLRMFELLGQKGLLGFRGDPEDPRPIPWLQNIRFYKHAAAFSGGLAISSFAHAQLGLQALHDFDEGRLHSAAIRSGIEGRAIFAFANTEPGAGSDAAGIALSAEQRDDGYVVNGTKSYITNGDIADWILFTAVTEPGQERRHKRISMFILDGGAPGLERRRLSKFGWKPSHLSVLRFRDVFVPAENRIGPPGQGFYQTMEIFNRGRIGVAALAFGTALGAYREAVRHANRRRVFGQLLMEHESKKNEFADKITSLEAAWLMIQKAAFLKDVGREFRYHASMAKLFATEQAVEIAQWAVELLGARGVLGTHPVSAYPHDARLAVVGEGAPEVQKKIIAENIEGILASL